MGRHRISNAVCAECGDEGPIRTRASKHGWTFRGPEQRRLWYCPKHHPPPHPTHPNSLAARSDSAVVPDNDPPNTHALTTSHERAHCSTSPFIDAPGAVPEPAPAKRFWVIDALRKLSEKPVK